MKIIPIFIKEETNIVEVPKEMQTKNSILSNCAYNSDQFLQDTIEFDMPSEVRTMNKASYKQLPDDIDIKCNIAVFVQGALQNRGSNYTMCIINHSLHCIFNGNLVAGENITFMY